MVKADEQPHYLVVYIFPRILPPSLDVHAHEYWYSRPYHKNQKEKSISDVPRRIRYEADDQGPEEGA
jgi:hypothetical protein